MNRLLAVMLILSLALGGVGCHPKDVAAEEVIIGDASARQLMEGVQQQNSVFPHTLSQLKAAFEVFLPAMNSDSSTSRWTEPAPVDDGYLQTDFIINGHDNLATHPAVCCVYQSETEVLSGIYCEALFQNIGDTGLADTYRKGLGLGEVLGFVGGSLFYLDLDADFEEMKANLPNLQQEIKSLAQAAQIIERVLERIDSGEQITPQVLEETVDFHLTYQVSIRVEILSQEAFTMSCAFHAPKGHEERMQSDALRRAERLVEQVPCVYPGANRAVFDEAIAEDRVALQPVEVSPVWQGPALEQEINRYFDALHTIDEALDTREDFWGTQDVSDPPINYLSLSPDGTRAFAAYRGIPFVWRLDTDDIKVLVPGEGITPAGYKIFNWMIRLVEDGGIAWSPDGRWLTISSPKRMLQLGRYDASVLLADIDAGSVSKLDQDLPDNVRARDIRDTGVPLRAAFSNDEPLLYYEAYGLRDDSSVYGEIRAVCLDTGRVETLVRIESAWAAAAPQLWDTPEGLLQSVFHYSSSEPGPRGLALYARNGKIRLMTRNEYEPSQACSVGYAVPSWAGERGVLMTVEPYSEASAHDITVQLFSLQDKSSEIFGHFIAVKPDNASTERLIPLSRAAYYDEVAKTLDFSNLGDVLLPKNAVLSPDGNYLLLAMNTEQPAMYLYDMQHNTLGAVDLSNTGIQSLTAYDDLTAGMFVLHWVGNNRLLIVHDGHYGIYELAIPVG